MINQKVRKFLIDQCVKGEPVYYEAIGKILGLTLSIDSDRAILSNTLGEISAFEYQNNRPLLSSIAIYKVKNDHGYGFYGLCQDLGIGKATKLSKLLYGFTQLEECKNFWKKAENYKAFYELQEDTIEHNLDFFRKEEIDFLALWVDRVYDKDKSGHVAAKEYIMNSLGTKTKYWSNQLVQMIPELETFNRRMWSKKGWEQALEGKKVRVARFKPYTWARIYRKGDRHKDIFFTVGADGTARQLVFKLDYYFEKDSHLNAEQKEIVKSNIPKELRWQSISMNEIDTYDWNLLLNETASFISQHLDIYDRLISLAWGDSEPQTTFSNFLRPQEAPLNGFETLPELKPSFNGVEKNYVQEALRKKEIGDAGEELVKLYEENWLKNIGHVDLSEQVEIVKDGKGYDILSFDEKRRPKYIEVKTTPGKSLKPFHLSINEKLFLEDHDEQYLVYRLYNYNEEKNTADFFIIKNVAQRVLMQPTDFKVYLKKSEQVK